MTPARSTKLFEKANGARSPEGTGRLQKPFSRPENHALTLALRLLSVTVGYGAMRLAVWALRTGTLRHRLSLLFVGLAAAVLCLLAAWLGTLASPRAVKRTWTAVGKGVLALLIFG